MLKIESPVLNLSTGEEKGEIVDRKPFIIRGHHLRDYANLINKWYLSPEIVAALLVLEIRMLASEIKNPKDPRGQSKRKYAEDVIGTSLKQSFRFGKNYSQALSQFLRLADDHPIEIVEGIPDNMCGACIIAEHCKRLTHDLGEGRATNALEGDRWYTEKFIATLDNFSLPKPTIAYEQAHFSDSGPQQARRIRTTIGIVRQVLKQTELEYWSRPK